MKTFFMNDYGEGAHPIVMQRLLETNMEHTCGYGLDDYSLRAADVIREKCGQPGAAVHIMVGGTSANSIAIAAFLRPYEAAICAPTGHINVHETGAVEATGHKVLPCAAKDGKVTPEGVEAVCALHTDEHMVAPRLPYTSQPTEICPSTVFRCPCISRALSSTTVDAQDRHRPKISPEARLHSQT